MYTSSEASSSSIPHQLIYSAFEGIFNDPEKLEHGIAKSNSNRGLRIYGKRIEKNGTQKEAVIDMCVRWLDNQKITYGLEDDDEIEIKRFEEAKKKIQRHVQFACTFL